MATKAAKSITINATKYELANALGVANGKLQLKAKDVVLDETELGGAEAIFVYNHYDSQGGYYVTDAIKDIEGNVLTNAQVCSKVKGGAQIYVQVVAASGSNTGKFQLLDKYEHEEHGGGAVVQEHFWSDDNSFSKYVGMTFRLADNFVSAPSINDNATGEFVITLAQNQNFRTAGAKTLASSFDGADLVNAIKIGKRIKVLVPKLESGNGDDHTDYAVITPDAYYDYSGANSVLVFGHYDNYNQSVSVKYLMCSESGTISSVTLV